MVLEIDFPSLVFHVRVVLFLPALAILRKIVGEVGVVHDLREVG